MKRRQRGRLGVASAPAAAALTAPTTRGRATPPPPSKGCRRPDPVVAARACTAPAGRGSSAPGTRATDPRVPAPGRHRRRGHMCVSKARWACGGRARATGRARAGAVRLEGGLWRRNIGRRRPAGGDRGRAARFPFLDEGVAARLLATPLCDVADLSGHEGGQAARPRRRSP